MISVEAVTKPRDLRDFIDLPARIYADCASFEPPLRVDRALLLDPRNRERHDLRKVRYWLARKGAQPVGRISAQLVSHPPKGVDPAWGMFGCLDAIDNREVIEALLEAARSWLADQGCTGMYGPCTLGMNDEPGLLVEGADEPVMTLSPWHPAYLGQQLEQAGLARLRDLHNWKAHLADLPAEAQQARQRLAERLPNLKVRCADRKNFARDIGTLCEIYNDGWQDNWGFVPLKPQDLAGLDLLMKWLVPREAFKFVELDGQPVAVILLIPNLFELTRGLGPRPGLPGWAKIAWRALTHRYRSGRIIVTGIARHLQGTVTGSAVASVLVGELVAGQSVLKGEWVEAGWVLEDNRALVQILERFHFRRNKTFRIFAQALKSPTQIH